MVRFWFVCGGVAGALGVALGAFGAHALKPLLPLQVMTIFETGVRYHLAHVPALLLAGVLIQLYPDREKWLNRSAVLFLAGLVLFSGSLYGYAMSDFRPLMYLTPVGGLAWIAAWLMLAAAFFKK